MGHRDQGSAREQKDRFEEDAFLQQHVGEYDQADPAREQQQGSGLAVLTEIGRHEAQTGDHDRDPDEDALNALAQQKA